jgi:Cu/Ag efflux protein CusF
MMRTAGTATLLLAPTLAAVLATAACGPPRGPELPPPDHVYDAQGVVYGVTRVEGERPEIVIHHQSIPEFVSREGRVEGMASMTMPFQAAPGVPLDDLEEGTPVAFRLEVRWEGDPTLLVTSVERLPPGTEVDFGEGHEAEPVPEGSEVPPGPGQGGG